MVGRQSTSERNNAMRIREAINILIFMRKAYENLIKNGPDDCRIIGKGINRSVPVKKSGARYYDFVSALNIAIEALESAENEEVKE